MFLNQCYCFLSLSSEIIKCVTKQANSHIQVPYLHQRTQIFISELAHVLPRLCPRQSMAMYVFNCRLKATGYRLQATGYRLQAIDPYPVM